MMLHKMLKCGKLIVFILAVFTGKVYSQIRLPRLVSDGMVLQRDMPVNVWGWASAGESIMITFNHKTYHCKTDENGEWRAKLGAMEAGGPYVMKISGNNEIQVKDVLIGDVWVCSGQSNMEFWMGRVKEKYAGMITTSTNDHIRQFLVEPQYNFQSPQQDVRSKAGWQVANPENVLQFSAVGYFFARDLYAKYHVPIGLIHSSRGGSPAEAWLSEDALKQFPNYYSQVQLLKDSAKVNHINSSDRLRSKDWNDQANAGDTGMINKDHRWYEPMLRDNDWKKIAVPGYWEETLVKPLDGVVWYRKTVAIPANMTGKAAILRLGSIADNDITYVNGVTVGRTNSRYFQRAYSLPAGLLKAGENEIVVRIVNTSGPGGFIKDKPYLLEAGGQQVSLSGEWTYKPGIIMPALKGGTTFAYKPLGLYNAMVAPLLNYAIKGVIWYQGEANTNRAMEYRSLFPAMIANWRKNWKEGDFPFLYVQLAGYLPPSPHPAPSQWAELREAQLMTLKIPHTGMATTSDIGEWNDVHPLNKEDVGARLALTARAVAYHEKDVVSSGPIYKSIRKEDNKIIISFTSTGSGLTSKAGQPLNGFAIAGADGRFVWAKGKINHAEVIVWSEEIKNPTAVRYAWGDFPAGANLYNKEGLPASPFRTDIKDQTEVNP
ncbi:sialate O-acetylesterase [Mucilaginibacter sp.]|uniref:sialate O-acetylesterase n=1 Tax=Mucilaginibacter sp. TaxID=1882438 RepID=UPI003568B58A